MLAAGDFVQVELLEDGNDAFPEITLGWDNREYTILRGKKAIVPFEAMVLRFGDPRSGENIQSIKTPGGGVNGWIPDRKSEVARLRLLWGAHADNYPKFDDIDVPNVRVYDLNNEPIATVMEDPEGKESIPVTQTESEKDAMYELLDRQQAQIDALRRELGVTDEISTESELPSDDELSPALFGGTGSNQ
jgi:hypothetical protein